MSEVTGAAPGRARPTTVTIATYLLYLVAVLELINAIVQLATAGTISRVAKEVYQGTAAAGSAGFITASTIGGAVLTLLLGVTLAILAVFNNRGKNAARIVTWVIGGLLLCCSGFGIAGSAVSSSMGGGGGANMPDPQELQRRLGEELPSWYTPLVTTAAILTVLALLGAIILLALPPSNEFFRRPQPTWEPPVPGYPAYPPAPGTAPQPPAPGTPGGPTGGQPGGPPAGGPPAPPTPPAG